MIIKLKTSRDLFSDEPCESKEWLYVETSTLRIEKFEAGPVPIEEQPSKDFIAIKYDDCCNPSPYYVLYTDKHIIALDGGISGYILNDKGQTVERLQ